MESDGGKSAVSEEDAPRVGSVWRQHVPGQGRKGTDMTQETTGKPYSKADREALATTACSELMLYGLWDHKTRVKQSIKKYFLRRQTAPEDLVFWPTGLLAAGLWEYRQALPGGCDQAAVGRADDREPAARSETILQIDQALGAYYTRWMKKGCPVCYLDDLLAGETLLSAYAAYAESGKDNGIVGAQNADVCQAAIGKLADYGMTYPTDEMGSFPYRAAQNNGYVFVDAIGLACPFLYRYGVVYHNTGVMELAVKQVVNFVAYGMDGATGLPYHGYVMNDAYKYGVIGWGRAVGWLLRGMAGCMITEYGAERLSDSYIRLVDAVLPYQHKEGYFSWQLQAMDGPVDTSATGMICAALKQGIGLHILTEPEYEHALQIGTNAICRSVREGRVYDCSGECEGFGQYPQRYGAYPWALGPALML